jgi:hypothetical protein
MYRRPHEGGSCCSQQRNEVDSFWDEKLVVDWNLGVIPRIKCQACDCGHFVPRSIFCQSPRRSQSGLSNSLENMLEENRQQIQQWRTLRSLESTFPRTLIDESTIRVSAIISQRREPIPPSVAARTSSSNAIMTIAVSSLAISAQIVFWIIGAS